MIQDDIDNPNYRNFLRLWATVTEQLLAFDPERIERWFEGVKQLASDPSLWRASQREESKRWHESGAATVATFRPEYAQNILGHVDIINTAVDELNDDRQWPESADP